MGAALVVYAAGRAVRFDTPVDRALPLVVLAIFALSWCVRRTRWWSLVQVAMPAAIVCELLPLEESARLVAIAITAAVAFGAALLAESEIGFPRGLFYTIGAVGLLRWIPWTDVRILRELLILGGAVLILIAFRNRGRVTPIAIAVAAIAALVTPAIPLRTIALPYVVAILAAIVPVRRVRADLLGSALCALLVALSPWSGVVARGLPFLLARHRTDAPREEIRVALAPSETFEISLPANATSLIVSGANVSRLRRGVTVGWIEPGHVALRIGDVADWGAMRRDQFFSSRLTLPRHPAGKLRGYGYSAWVDGAARVALPVRSGMIRVTADPNLPPRAQLQIEAVETGGR